MTPSALEDTRPQSPPPPPPEPLTNALNSLRRAVYGSGSWSVGTKGNTFPLYWYTPAGSFHLSILERPDDIEVSANIANRGFVPVGTLAKRADGSVDSNALYEMALNAEGEHAEAMAALRKQ